jgi:GT2 family glycosyltransferase
VNIAIVTPWKDHLDLADDYFEAVLPEMEEGDECIVVDNDSDPPLKFGTLPVSQNLGFCGGCNLGLHSTNCDAVLFLNNDIELRRRGWLSEIRKALEPGVLVGPLRGDTHAWIDGTPLPYIDGWCLAGMREDLLELGGFDETLAEPAYYSDNLLCLEARAAGMTLRDVRVGLHHKLNATAGPAFESRVREATAVNRVRYEARARELLVSA